MSTITLESIEAKQAELQQLIAKFKADQSRTVIVPTASIQLAPGEAYAGLILNAGTPLYHLVLLPGDEKGLTFSQAKKWADRLGGRLPSPQEQSLLFANLKSHFQGALYWSGQVHASNSSSAGYQNFSHGYQSTGHETTELRARAVRREYV
jgi:hypothetical protein